MYLIVIFIIIIIVVVVIIIIVNKPLIVSNTQLAVGGKFSGLGVSFHGGMFRGSY